MFGVVFGQNGLAIDGHCRRDQVGRLAKMLRFQNVLIEVQLMLEVLKLLSKDSDWGFQMLEMFTARASGGQIRLKYSPGA